MKKGELFFTSRGEYSDYGIGAFFRAKKQFSFDAENERFRDKRDYPPLYPDRTMMLYQHLIDSGLAEEVPVREVYLGYRWESIEPAAAKDREDDIGPTG
jgi:hypothetical protein